MSAEQSDTWMIRVSGYGTFEFVGTEAEAEEMRAHKARWEHASGQKWRITNPTEADKVRAEMAALWEAGQGVPVSVQKRLRAALAKDAK